MITSCRQPQQLTSSDRTPFWRMLAKSIGSIVYLKHGVAILPSVNSGAFLT
jgi:hypothetical protein